MTAAILGHGTRVFMGALTDSATLTEIAEVTNVNLPNEQIPKVEVTSYTSPNRTREYISGLNDPGEISMTINWIPGNATDDLLVAAKDDGLQRTMRIVVPGGQQYTFRVLVTGKAPAIPVDGQMTAEITLGVAGAVTQEETFDDPTDLVETP